MSLDVGSLYVEFSVFLYSYSEFCLAFSIVAKMENGFLVSDFTTGLNSELDSLFVLSLEFEVQINLKEGDILVI